MDNKYFKILGISENASKEEIEEAYHKCLIKYHPDKYEASDEKLKKEMAKKLEEVQDAYNKIMNNSDKKNDHVNKKDNAHPDKFSDFFNPYYFSRGFNSNLVRYSNERAFDDFQKFYQQKQEEIKAKDLDFSYVNQMIKDLNKFVDSKNRGKIELMEIINCQDRLNSAVKIMIKNAEAFDDFQMIFTELKEKFDKYKLKYTGSMEKYINKQNRGKTTAIEFVQFQTKIENAIKNAESFYDFQNFYKTMQQKAKEKGRTITIDEKYLNVENRCKINKQEFDDVQHELEKEFDNKSWQLQRYNELMMQLDIIDCIFIRHGKSLDEPKEYLDGQSMNQFKKYIEENHENVNYDNMNFVNNKLIDEIRNLLEEQRKKYVSKIYMLDQKHNLYKILGPKFKIDHMTNGQLEFLIKSLAEFMENASFFQRKSQLFGFAVTLKKQLDDYDKKVLEVSSEIDKICKINNIIISSLFPHPYNLGYLSYEELQAIWDNLLKRFSVDQNISDSMDEEFSSRRAV